jgi:hypothetical protein
VKNVSNEPINFSSENQALVDSKGKSYSPDDDAWIYTEDSDPWGEIDPGNTLKTTVPFDVSKRAEPDQLLLKAGVRGFSEGVRVKLEPPRSPPSRSLFAVLAMPDTGREHLLGRPINHRLPIRRRAGRALVVATSTHRHPAHRPEAVGRRPRVRGTPLRAPATRRVSWLTSKEFCAVRQRRRP